MASASVDTSPHPLSPYEFEFPPNTESNGDSEEAFWTAISNPSAGTGSVGGGFISSPASHSLGSSWAVLGHGGLQSPGVISQASPLSGASLEQSGNAVFGGESAPGDVNQLFAQGLVQDGQDLLVPAPGEFELAFDTQFTGK